MPENVAIARPFHKLNSVMAGFAVLAHVPLFAHAGQAADGDADQADDDAQKANLPAVRLQQLGGKSPFTIGGTSVPNAAQ